jgi:hypothetical protein
MATTNVAMWPIPLWRNGYYQCGYVAYTRVLKEVKWLLPTWLCGLNPGGEMANANVAMWPIHG